MSIPTSLDEASDSEDLQALFDTIAAGSPAPVPPPAPARDASGDNDDLQALFDSVVSQVAPVAGPAPVGAAAGESEDEIVFNRLGHIARQLHDSLRELGYDKVLEQTASQMPDARQRLNYIVEMTDKAASRVLNATDIAKPLQDDLLGRSEAMAQRWDKMFANQLSVDEFKALAADSRAYFTDAPGKLRTINEQTLEITMAQDFQDLTGQVIKKVIDMVQGLETQLLQTLIEAMPAGKKAEASEGLLNGPVINAAGRSDVVTNQEQVDELLESLGF
ncbi:MAG: protein phosphatase CheZ [Gammaproteobacteria bacterium]|nr:protein phosphatase CheZ [Gammaproteobacteria bacterium]MBU1646156.1 protein phosphatase CheZ [Gammaproteobacteria bacterium]MBU1972218.1 protein phosphatase CheZ [Gammaproteobacteria bacterium]